VTPASFGSSALTGDSVAETLDCALQRISIQMRSVVKRVSYRLQPNTDARRCMSDDPYPVFRTRYGTDHPERIENELWQLAIAENWTGYNLRQDSPGTDAALLDRAAVCINPSLSTYRESVPGPYFSWERFGRTSTALPDGRIIHIAGEHEDSYDTDFCIYNDVIVEHPDGRREIFLYPQDAFPPTDFHSATLVGADVILIGSLGYQDLRRVGETQVLRLDPQTLMFEKLASTGDGPGWISRHVAELVCDKSIVVVGGKIQTEDGYVDNHDIFELDLASMKWSRRTHGDPTIFSVIPEDYRRFRSPAFGTANPERVTNPFWLEMARRDWSPSRARLHFGDFAPPRPRIEWNTDAFELEEKTPEFGTPEFEARMAALSADIDRSKLTRRREDVIWTAKREDPGCIRLPDGRQLLIGGTVKDYGNEYADPWTYNDIVVRQADGTIAIYSYPRTVFPQLWGWVLVPHHDTILIFGFTDQKLHPERSDRFVALSLDVATFAISTLAIKQPEKFRLNLYPGCEQRDGLRVIFPNMRMTSDEPMLGIALDLDSLTWGEPFTHEHPRATEDD
jgi:hypothetical protein